MVRQHGHPFYYGTPTRPPLLLWYANTATHSTMALQHAHNFCYGSPNWHTFYNGTPNRNTLYYGTPNKYAFYNGTPNRNTLYYGTPNKYAFYNGTLNRNTPLLWHANMVVPVSMARHVYIMFLNTFMCLSASHSTDAIILRKIKVLSGGNRSLGVAN